MPADHALDFKTNKKISWVYGVMVIGKYNSAMSALIVHWRSSKE